MWEQMLQKVLTSGVETAWNMAGQAWDIMVYQAWLNGIAWLVQAVILLVLTGLLAKWTRWTFQNPKMVKKNNYSDEMEKNNGENYFEGVWVPKIIVQVSLWCTLGILDLVVFFHVEDILTCLFNPQYVALQNLLQMLL